MVAERQARSHITYYNKNETFIVKKKFRKSTRAHVLDRADEGSYRELTEVCQFNSINFFRVPTK